MVAKHLVAGLSLVCGLLAQARVVHAQARSAPQPAHGGTFETYRGSPLLVPSSYRPTARTAGFHSDLTLHPVRPPHESHPGGYGASASRPLTAAQLTRRIEARAAVRHASARAEHAVGVAQQVATLRNQVALARPQSAGAVRAGVATLHAIDRVAAGVNHAAQRAGNELQTAQHQLDAVFADEANAHRGPLGFGSSEVSPVREMRMAPAIEAKSSRPVGFARSADVATPLGAREATARGLGVLQARATVARAAAKVVRIAEAQQAVGTALDKLLARPAGTGDPRHDTARLEGAIARHEALSEAGASALSELRASTDVLADRIAHRSDPGTPVVRDRHLPVGFAPSSPVTHAGGRQRLGFVPSR